MEVDFDAGGSRLQIPGRPGGGTRNRLDSELETEAELEAQFVDSLTMKTPEQKAVDAKLQIVLEYWKQQSQKAALNKRTLGAEDIQAYVEQALANSEVDNKDKIKQEVQFIIAKFRQRRCRRFVENNKHFYSRAFDYLKKFSSVNIGEGKILCKCGLDKWSHTECALSVSSSEKWSIRDDTETVFPWMFGNLDIPGHYNYLEMPGGTKKYLRLDDTLSKPKDVWTLLIKHWDFHHPNLVISVTGGDMSQLKEDIELLKAFQKGIMASCVKTRAWIITDGMATGTAREIGETFQFDLRKSEYSEIDDHATVPLIGIGPWGLLADRHQLQGIHVGSEEATYNLLAQENSVNHSESIPNALDPYHVAYLLTDDGTSGMYKQEAALRFKLEKYIKKSTKLQFLGSKAVNTPLVILVLGGDRFTLEKISNAVKKDVQIAIVIVNGSGPIPDMLATIYKSLEYRVPRSTSLEYGWSVEEEQILKDHLTKYKETGVIKTESEEEYIKVLMNARHLVEIFGVQDADTRDLDSAILTAIFGGISDIALQLFLSLAMDRVDVAREAIFVESRKEELKKHSDMLQQALLIALQSGKSSFVQLLLDQDYAGDLNEFNKFLTTERLYSLHSQNLSSPHILSKVLKSFCRRDTFGDYILDEENLLPQVGRILYNLMGDLYRLLYQENAFRDVCEKPIPFVMTSYSKEEGVWHLFLWAVLANQIEMAELFLYESNCKIGAALLAYKLLMGMSKAAKRLHEVELEGELRKNARYFEDLAIHTLDNLYESQRDEAYATLVSLIPFHWARYATPLSIADDGAAMHFMGHACCQTLLNLVWMKHMDLATSYWRLIPFWALFPPINIALIVFDKHSLSYGLYKQKFITEEKNDNKRERQDSVQSSAGSRRGSQAEYSDQEQDSKVSTDDDCSSYPWHAFKKRMRFTWFCLKNYYTAPCNKFLWNFVSYIVFLGLFSHFTLSELKPVSSIGDITIYEWLVIVWVFGIFVDEMAQILTLPVSGPTYNLRWIDLEPDWKKSWLWHERLAFVLKWYRIKRWFSDRWNKVDALMLISFYVTMILRFSLNTAHFDLVRMLYSLTLIFFYLRILRMGYIMVDIGPRIVTIKAMLKDLFQFLLILIVFIISFGIAFQAILDSNKEPSWDLLIDIIWRPYWQMYGELFLEDVTDGMGRESVERNCTYDWKLAEANPETMRICYNWTAPVLLGIYMLITNILLLNLLIAIFSHSFDLIESEAMTIWRYHLYDLVHEYYYQVWLPPPLNLICHFFNTILWLSKWPRIWCYTLAKKRHTNDIYDEKSGTALIASGVWGLQELNRRIEMRVRKDFCFPLYFDKRKQEELYLNHFVQPEYMRDEDLEEKAYKRYCRSKKTSQDSKTQKLLLDHNNKLLSISNEIQDIKTRNDSTSAGDTQPPPLIKRFSKSSSRASIMTPASNDLFIVKTKMVLMETKMNTIEDRVHSMSRDLNEILNIIKKKGQ